MFSLCDDDGTITPLLNWVGVFAAGSFLWTQTIPPLLSVNHVSYWKHSTVSVVTCQHFVQVSSTGGIAVEDY